MFLSKKMQLPASHPQAAASMELYLCGRSSANLEPHWIAYIVMQIDGI